MEEQKNSVEAFRRELGQAVMDLARQRQLLAVYCDGLLNDTLPFCWPRCVDEEHGGFMLARDRDGSLLDTDKGISQQCRAKIEFGGRSRASGRPV